MDEETIKELYELYKLINYEIDNWPSERFISWFKTNKYTGEREEVFKEILDSYVKQYSHKFDEQLRVKLIQLIDTDDVANHHIAFRLIYQQFKNT